MKICNKCSVEQPLSNFGRDKRNKDGKQGICYSCNKLKNKHRYYHNEAYRLSMIEKQLHKKRQRKLDGIKYKGGKCFDCKNEYPAACYEFHHEDPAQKDVNPAHFKSASWEKYRKELDKCVLLCANCHRIRHWSQYENK